MFLVCGAMLAMSAVTETSAHAALNVFKSYVDPSLCLSVSGGVIGDGGHLILWTCDPNRNIDQNWNWNVSFQTEQIPAIYPTSGPQSPQCISLANNGATSDGTQAVTWRCSVNTTDQYWTATPAFVNFDGKMCYYFNNKKAGDQGTSKVFALASPASVTKGANVLLETFHDSQATHPEQYWCVY